MTQKPKKRLQIRFDWKIILSATLCFSLLMKLGFWQLSRADEKRQMQRTIDTRKLAPPQPIESLPMESKDALKYLRVSLHGAYINEKLIFIVNKFFKGRLGYEVITPFQLNSTGQIVLVSRGWIPGSVGVEQLPKVMPVRGVQQLIAEIYVPPGKSFFLVEKLDGKAWPFRLHHFNMNGFDEIFINPLFPYIVRLGDDNPGVLERYWPAIIVKPESSTSYALQWFGMALAVLVMAIMKSTNLVEIIRAGKGKRS